MSSWKNVKKKFEKNMLIQNYVLSLKANHNLSIQESRKCLDVIISAINMKQILSDDIIMKNNEIVDIKGMEIVDGKCVLPIRKEKISTRSYVESKPFEFLGSKWALYKQN